MPKDLLNMYIMLYYITSFSCDWNKFQNPEIYLIQIQEKKNHVNEWMNE